MKKLKTRIKLIVATFVLLYTSSKQVQNVDGDLSCQNDCGGVCPNDYSIAWGGGGRSFGTSKSDYVIYVRPPRNDSSPIMNYAC